MLDYGAVVAKPVVFILDDDESVCRALVRLMKSVGYDVQAYSSPEDFLDQVSQNICDCLILDVRMPRVDGLEVQDRLRASGAQIPVVFITAHEDAAAREQAMKAGAVAFIQKPFEDEVLLDAVHSGIERTQG